MHKRKDSGVEWIGEIPAHWDPIRFRFIAKIATGNQDTQNADPEGKYPFYVRSPIVERCNNYTFDGEGILMAGDGAGAGRVFHLADGKYAVHQRVYRFYDFKYVKPVLLKYYLENLFAMVMDYGSAKTTVPSVRLPMIQDFVVCVSPEKEQTSIIEKLNEKCAQINALISNVQTQIEKLKAYKQSLITEVVTKGLDLSVPMKDSGVEWIGEIPETWNTIRVKQLLKERKERSVDGLEEPLSMSQKLGLVPTRMMDMVPNMASSFVGAKLAYIDDLVFNKLKAHLGVFSVSKYDGLVSPDYAVYYSTGKVHLKYLEYLFKTPQCISEFRKRSTGIAAGLTRLYTDGLFAIECPFPDMDEQVAIVDYLNEKCSHIDQLIAIKQAKIEKLEQYKRSLIYEYVTGKKEVPAQN